LAYDTVIIGTGVAASTAAGICRAAGRSVAVIDERPFGGTCALRGCDPKKVLVGAAQTLDHVRRMRSHGVDADGASINWRELMAHKRRFTDSVPAQRQSTFVQQKIDTFQGHARFADQKSIAVGNHVLHAKRILIAAGAQPVKLGISGEEHLVTSDEFLELEELPCRIVMVGGGYIAAEFSNVAACAGARVTILQRGERMLPNFDPDLTDLLMDRFADLSIDVRTGTRVEAVAKDGHQFEVRASSQGRVEIFEADLVLHAAGRAPNLAALDLPAGGVEADKGKLRLNDLLQSVSNPTVYAAGDAASVGPPLTPVSAQDAEVAAHNMLDSRYRRVDYRAVPSVAFTVPPIATVGLSEAAARSQGLQFRRHFEKASDWYTAKQAAEPTYGFKTLIDEVSDRLLGAHLIGPHADEVINLFAIAIRHGVTARQLKDMRFAYPTGASDIRHML
jgi:glutathione reductase (NADPH)